MTQGDILVSPKPSACLKPGNSSDLRPSLGLRPSDLGDTAAHVARVSQPARHTPAPSYPHTANEPRASVLDCGGPTPLFRLTTCHLPLTTFFRKYLITSLFSANQPLCRTSISVSAIGYRLSAILSGTAKLTLCVLCALCVLCVNPFINL